MTIPGSAGRTFSSKYITPDRQFATALRSFGQQHRQQPSQQKQQQSSVKNKHQDTNQIAGQSVQAKNININAVDEMFAAFTTVQQIIADPAQVLRQKKRLAS
jgi:hypothetical protein